MPYLDIATNAPLGDSSEQQSLLSEVTKLVSEHLGKPTAYVMVRIAPVGAMRFADDPSPCCLVSVRLIGKAAAGARAALSADVTSALQRSLRVEPGRVFVTFDELAASHWAMAGDLFG